MTVSYNQDIINSHSLTFLRVIFRWRGSLWKSVLYEVTLWLLCYYAVLIVYRMYLDKTQQLEFEHIAKYTDVKMDYIPLSFMHGFYVAFVVDRWKQIFANIGFVDSAAFWIATYLEGTDHESRTHRRNLIRYLCATQVMVLRDISIPVRRRFPTIQSLVDVGLIQEHEMRMMESVQNGFPRYWMPIHWMFTLGMQLCRHGKLSAGQLEAILNEAKAFREKLQLLLNFDWVPVPLAYSQVVYMATRVYFFLCLFSRQFRVWEQRDSVVYLEYYFPLMTFLQLICYMGWLKVAEALLNPLGEDDDDFESCYIVDRNLAVGMTMVDECYGQIPDQMPDKFGREGEPPPSEPGLSDPQHQLVGSAELAAEHNPNSFADLIMLDSRKSPINNQPDRKRSRFTSMVRRALGGGDEQQQNWGRRSSAAIPELAGTGDAISRKSKSIASSSPFTISQAPFSNGLKFTAQNDQKTAKSLPCGLEQFKADKNVCKIESPTSAEQRRKHFLERVTEEDDDDETTSDSSVISINFGTNRSERSSTKTLGDEAEKGPENDKK